MNKPRNLRLLPIDDGLLTPTMVASRKPNHVDYMSAHAQAISKWSDALSLWSNADLNLEADLITTDVLGELDSSTPLSRILGFPGHPLPIPTMLMHVLPFAALARRAGKPMGIGLHTIRPQMWSEAWQANHAMGALAAHVIGELAAILGDNCWRGNVNDTVSECWRWLEAHREADFPPAFCMALKDFRRRLVMAADAKDGPPRVIVMPQDFAQLMAWVEKQHDQPVPIGTDIGLPLVYADGHHDHIRLASLFGENNDIDIRQLPAACFESDDYAAEEGTGNGPWCLDDDGRPQIGRFLRRFGFMAIVWKAACDLVEQFPTHLEEGERLHHTLAATAANMPHRNMVCGLAILFQAVRWEFWKYQCWQEHLGDQGWKPKDLRFDRDDASRYRLGDLLEQLVSFIPHHSDFYPGGVLEGRNWPNPRDLFQEVNPDAHWVRWHFDQLVAAGVLKKTEENQYCLRKALKPGQPLKLELSELPVPSPLPPGFEWSSPGVVGFLRDSFGFGGSFGPNASDDDNAIGRMLAAAFCPAGQKKPEDGRTFLKQVLDGHSPAWLLVLLQAFAREQLAWDEEITWPMWLRSSGW